MIWVLQSVAVAALARSLPPPRGIRRRPGLTVTVLMRTLVGGSIVSLGLRRSVAIDGPRNAAGLVIADETVRIVRQQ